MEIFGANLKMNPGFSKALEDLLRDYVKNGVAGNDKKEVVVFLPFVFLDLNLRIRWMLLDNKIGIGAQDVSEHVSGAYTRQTSPLWLREFGVSRVLIGHSEVRQEYESLSASQANINHLFHKKINNALSYGLKVVYCVGETLEERNQQAAEKIIERQIRGGLEKLKSEDLENIAIAYEPRWAIGTNLTPEDDEILTAHGIIREAIDDLNTGYNSENMPVMYGGSMKQANAAKIMAIQGVDGGLIGGASLNADEFAKIVNYK